MLYLHSGKHGIIIVRLSNTLLNEENSIHFESWINRFNIYTWGWKFTRCLFVV